MPKDGFGFTPIGDILPSLVRPQHRPISRIEERLIEPVLDSAEILYQHSVLSGSIEPVLDSAEILYQHSVLCQTCMPYRDPGGEKIWLRHNGNIRLELQAGRVLDPNLDEVVDVGLPFGPKPRLVFYHLNAEAMRTQSPVVALEDSLTAFVKRTLKLDGGGRTIRSVKDQLNRLAAADFRFYVKYQDHAVTVKGTVIEGLDLWVSKDERQRVLWPSVVQFSQRYFQSLLAHAVPLNENAVAKLSHSAMGLDIYTWLAQRLHRVSPSKPALVPWVSLYEQFGHGYKRIRDFRRVFVRTLKFVKIVYHEAAGARRPRRPRTGPGGPVAAAAPGDGDGFCARLVPDDKGLRLWNSPPPVPRRLVQVK